jgi:hypothetical protein
MIMPVKRRGAPKARPTYPATVQALLAGQQIAPSAEAKNDLLGVMYFNDWPELTADEKLRRRASDILDCWPADWQEQAHARETSSS